MSSLLAPQDVSQLSTVDLRSDFIVRPSPAALAAMQDAARQSSAFGLREDSRQLALEAELAAMLGKDDALIFPTCTMANQVGIALHTRPGDMVLAPNGAHAAASEAGAAAALSGVRMIELADPSPAPAPEVWARHLTAQADEQRSAVTLFFLENTHNRASGTPIPWEYNAALVQLARDHGVAMHLDGARLLHAAVALHCSPAQLALEFDTVSISLNKSLGGLIGAALAGSRRAMSRALVLRQRMGGGLRAIGPQAAGTMVALAGWKTLAEDHRRAERLVAGLTGLRGISVVPVNPRTNIVVLRSPLPADAFCAGLALHSVYGIPFGPNQVRLVIHRDIDDAAIDRAIMAIKAVVRRYGQYLNSSGSGE